MIEAIGLCKTLEKIDITNINLIRYPQLEVINSGYIGYLNDNLKIVKHIPPLSLSETFLDFGQRDINNKINISSAISVTNNTKEIIIFKWDL
ncbi:hypothetical protein L9F63_026383, partial [Diploptera punctata]